MKPYRLLSLFITTIASLSSALAQQAPITPNNYAAIPEYRRYISKIFDDCNGQGKPKWILFQDTASSEEASGNMALIMSINDKYGPKGYINYSFDVKTVNLTNQSEWVKFLPHFLMAYDKRQGETGVMALFNPSCQLIQRFVLGQNSPLRNASLDMDTLAKVVPIILSTREQALQEIMGVGQGGANLPKVVLWTRLLDYNSFNELAVMRLLKDNSALGSNFEFRIVLQDSDASVVFSGHNELIMPGTNSTFVVYSSGGRKADRLPVRAYNGVYELKNQLEQMLEAYKLSDLSIADPIIPNGTNK